MEVIKGDITQFSGADVLVNIVTQQNKNLESHGAIAKSFAKAGGDEWKQGVEKHLPLTKQKPVISTGPGKLKCKKVIHIKAEKLPEKADRAEKPAKLEELFDKTFGELRSLRFVTIAIPVFGGGFLNIEPAHFYDSLSKAYYKASKECPELKVTVISFEEKAYQAIIKHINNKDKKKLGRQHSKTDKPSTSGRPLTREISCLSGTPNPPKAPVALQQPLKPTNPVPDDRIVNKSTTVTLNPTPGPLTSSVKGDRKSTTGTQIDVQMTVEHRRQSGALIPKFWKKCPGEKTSEVRSKHDDFQESIRLGEQTSDYQYVKKMFLETFKNETVVVNEILRVENSRLYYLYELSREKYCTEKAQANFKTLTDTYEEDTLTSAKDFSEINKRLIHDINEKYLFHGTKKADLDAIITQGFDSRVSNAGYFGAGTYFAEHPEKSNDYTDCTYDDRVMLLSRVILGDIYRCPDVNKGLRRPPCTRCNEDTCDHKRRYDSVMGIYKHFREFVIYEHGDRIYPEFVICYSVGKNQAAGKVKDGYKKPANK